VLSDGGSGGRGHFGRRQGASTVVTRWTASGVGLRGFPFQTEWFSGALAFSARSDLPLSLRMMAPSTRRSRKAMASGPSERYSPHFSKSTFVTRAVDRFWLRAAMIL
jgi:hypothetical protein